MAADSALGFLAQLAAMKAAGGTTAYAGGDDDEPKKKKKKKKTKKGKKKEEKKEKKKEEKKEEKKETGGKKGTADSALGFLAQLAAMKASGGTTAYVGGDDDGPKKKKKKGKKGKKKGKKTKRASMIPVVPIHDEPDDEKTPEPPSNLSEIEKRKFRLKYARRKLEKRKKQRELVRAQKANKMGLNALNSSIKSDDITYGKTYINKFMKQLETEQAFIQSKIADALQMELEEEEERKRQKKENDLLRGLGLSSDAASKRKKEKHKSLDRKPGRINMLTIGNNDNDMINHRYLNLKRVKCSDKQCMTDPIMFEDYLREEFFDDFVDEETGNNKSMDIKVISGLIESTTKYGYPRELWEIESAQSPSPSPTANKIRQRQKAEEERKRKVMAERERRRMLKEKEEEKRKNIPYMLRKDANRMIKRGDFLENFRKKTKWIERTLGINMEYMESIRDRNDDFFDDESEDELIEEEKEMDLAEDEEKETNIKQQKQKQKDGDKVYIKSSKQRKKKVIKNYLRLKKTFCVNKLRGRPIGNIAFSEGNHDWFASTYFVAGNRYNTDNNGCIGIWNFMLPTYPEYTLHAENMITSTHFHPTDPFFIFGSTINGQILMWDLRNNKSSPIERSNFSNGHSAPVFTMSFLPNIKQKQAEIAKRRGKKPVNSKKQNKQKTDSNHEVQHILSVSNDGKLCIWRTDQLSVKPLNQSILKPSDDQSTARQIELITTCFDFTYRDHGNVILGSDEGYLYKAEIFNQNSNNDQSLSISESIAGHYGPITCVQFFPIQYFGKNYNFKDNVSGLYLTSSYDWTVKLWHNKIGTKLGKHQNGPIAVFDQMTDYVYDVKWNIGGKPGVFACCDGEGQINIFDLTQDFKHPITKQPVKISQSSSSSTNNKNNNIAATTLSWTLDGKYLSCGDSDGNISFYNVHKSISTQTLESCELFQSVANKYVA